MFKVIRIWFRDGTFRSMRVTKDMTIEDVTLQIAKRMGMEMFAAHFSINEVKRGVEEKLERSTTLYSIKEAWEKEGYKDEIGQKGEYKLIFNLKRDSEVRLSRNLDNRYLVAAGESIAEKPKIASAGAAIEQMEAAAKRKLPKINVPSFGRQNQQKAPAAAPIATASTPDRQEEDRSGRQFVPTLTDLNSFAMALQQRSASRRDIKKSGRVDLPTQQVQQDHQPVKGKHSSVPSQLVRPSGAPPSVPMPNQSRPHTQGPASKATLGAPPQAPKSAKPNKQELHVLDQLLCEALVLDDDEVFPNRSLTEAITENTSFKPGSATSHLHADDQLKRMLGPASVANTDVVTARDPQDNVWDLCEELEQI